MSAGREHTAGGGHAGNICPACSAFIRAAIVQRPPPRVVVHQSLCAKRSETWSPHIYQARGELEKLWVGYIPPLNEAVGSCPSECYVCYVLAPRRDATGFQHWRDTVVDGSNYRGWTIYFDTWRGLDKAARFGISCMKDVLLPWQNKDDPKPHRPGADSNATHARSAVDSIPKDLLSDEGMRIVRERWLPDCLRGHSPCNQPWGVGDGTHIDPRPTRVVHVQDAGRSARLVNTSSVTPYGFRYLTLSHSWGPVKFLTLTMSNLDEFRQRIPLERADFNQTFRDAIAVTALLGYSYLWIDSLCIIQDSPGGVDWTAECPRMATVYTRSDLNLSASGYENPQSGMLAMNRRALVPPLLELADGTLARVLLHEEYGDWPLEKRGWVMQENLLASRTLHFTPRGLVWECHDGVVSEIWPLKLTNFSITGPIKEQRKNVITQKYTGEVVSSWYRMVAEYSSRRLTFPRDKLPAIQGLAKAVDFIPGLNYQAGHWMGYRFLESLLWRTGISARSYDDAVGPVAPSWSWASVNGMVVSPLETNRYCGFYGDTVALARVLRSETSGEILIPSSVVSASVALLMSARVYSLGDALEDLFRYRMSSQHPGIALRTQWLPQELLRPQKSMHKPYTDPWGDGDERAWVNIHLDHHWTSVFDLLFLSSAQDDCSTEEWLDIRMRGHRPAIMICLLTLEDASSGGMDSECHVHGLLLRQAGEQEGRPVCERIGRVTVDLRWQEHLNVQKHVEDIGQHEIYLV